MTPQELIANFGLRPHPEGGYFRETYRSPVLIPAPALPGGLSGDRSLSTAILFLLPRGARSHLHRLRSDEVWHFYLGGPLEMVRLGEPGGQPERIVLGQDLAAGQLLQYVVPANTWFGAAPMPGSDYSLVGCTVAPGFEFSDFELGARDELTRLFPGLAALIDVWAS